MKPLLAAAALLLPLCAREPLAQRIGHTDPAKYRDLEHVHGGAGRMNFMELLGRDALNTNLLFVHRGVLQPKGGIGHHYHNHMEEMFVILNGEAQFTVDGRTSLLHGPALAPCRMGHSHGIYNATDRPVEWMNIGVGSIKGKYDNFDLGDDRVGVPLDAKPVFISARLDKALLKPSGPVRYRRVLPPELFFTNWSYIDHVAMAPGASLGKTRHEGVEEVYYVMSGSGVVRVNEERAEIHAGDAVPVLFGDVHSFENTGSGDLEMLIVGIARAKWALDSVEVK